MSARQVDAAPAVRRPEDVFGFRMGADRALARWPEMLAYFRELAAGSDRLRYQELGRSTEGQPFVLLTLSAPENLRRLDHYGDIQQRLADPRDLDAATANELI